jgi:hypothetical protein
MIAVNVDILGYIHYKSQPFAEAAFYENCCIIIYYRCIFILTGR